MFKDVRRGTVLFTHTHTHTHAHTHTHTRGAIIFAPLTPAPWRKAKKPCVVFFGRFEKTIPLTPAPWKRATLQPRPRRAIILPKNIQRTS